MKIGLIFDGMTLPPKDGVTYRAFHVAKQLQETKRNKIFIYLGDRGWCSKKELQKAGLKNIRLFPSNWLYERKNLAKVYKIIKKDKIDLLHVCNSHTVVLNFGKHLSHKLEVPLVCDMHDVEYALLSRLKKSKKQIEQSKRYQKLSADCSSKVIFMSKDEKVSLLNMGIPKDKLVNIPNGTDPQQLKKYLKNQKSVLFVGNLYYAPNRKAADYIHNEIAPQIYKADSSIKFLIAGRLPPDCKSDLPNLKYIGPADDLSEVLKDVFVALAPIQIGSGMKVKILTYSSYGVPTIATSKALEGYASAPVFKAETSAEFVKKILFFSNNPSEARRIGVKAFNWVNQKYSWGDLIKKILKVYNQCLKDKKFQFNYNISNKMISIINKENIDLPFWLKEERFKI